MHLLFLFIQGDLCKYSFSAFQIHVSAGDLTCDS